MNQTKKRLSIINLAISITDIETIQLQISKLRLLHADAKIQDIITVLQEESYAKAQGLITAYIEAPTEEVIQRAAPETTTTAISREDQAIIDEFQLFVTPNVKEPEQTVDIDINDYYEEDLKITKQPTPNNSGIDFDSLLNIDPKDVLVDNITLDISDNFDISNNEDTFFEFDIKKTKPVTLDTTSIPKDTFFDNEEPTLPEIKNVKQEELLFVEEEKTVEKKTVLKKEEIDTPFPTLQTKKRKKTSSYNAIPDIAQKLVSLKKQYPPVQKTYEKFTTVEELLNKISKDGYSEREIEETFSYIKQLISKTKYTEATQLLLVCASTESKFGQLMLARELFKGVLLQKNIPEAFELMKALATDDYPEALCDLGQFYENAIGTTENKIKAEKLYKEATKAGIKRAKKHHTRLKKQNKAFF